VAEEIADRIGIISLGRLVTIGRMEELAAQSGIRGTLEDVFLKVAQDPTAPVLPEEPNHVAG
jgi:ABC-type multidrug transport system ATPase subunit